MNPLDYLATQLFRLFRQLHLSRLMGMTKSTRCFTDYFKGYEKVEAIRGIFGDQTEEVLANLKVEFVWFGYMGVDNHDGHLMVNERYLNSGDKTDIYLDVVHELCHVKQWMDGRDLFDPHYSYVDRPTEVEAYRYAVLEAKRIGLSNEQILAYLKTEWISSADLKRLIKNMDVDLGAVNF